MSIAEKLTTIAENEQKVYKAGQDKFLHETMLSNGKRTFFGYMFRSCEDLVEPPYFDTSKSTSFQSMFYGCHSLKRIPQYDFSNASASPDLFVECYELEELPEILLSKSQNTNYLFLGCKKLKRVAKLDMTKSTTGTNMFGSCFQLEDITFVGDIRPSVSFADCPLLSNDSVNSIINALIDNREGATTRRLTLHPDVKARLTSEQITAITQEKGWELA